VNGAEHVVVGEEVVKAQVLGLRPDPLDSARDSAELGLRVDDADLQGAGRRLLHGLHRAFSQSCRCRCSRGGVMSQFPAFQAFMQAPRSQDACLCRQVAGLALAPALAGCCVISRTA
jgi:hypothetical protein